MDLKKLLLPIMLIVMLVSASAAITVTINKPTSGQVFFPKLENQRTMDVNITVVDNNADVSVHIATIQYKYGDTNTFIWQDQNIGSDECSFAVANVWTGLGATCQVTYTFPRRASELSTNTYVLDVNVSGVDETSGAPTVSGEKVGTFGINNRLVDTGTEAIIGLAMLALAAVIIISLVLFLGQFIDGKTTIIIVGATIAGILALLIMAEFIAILTP